MPIKEGDIALLIVYGKKGRPKKFLVKVERKKVLHTHKGVIDIGSLIGEDWGIVTRTAIGTPVEVHRPTLADIV